MSMFAIATAVLAAGSSSRATPALPVPPIPASPLPTTAPAAQAMNPAVQGLLLAWLALSVTLLLTLGVFRRRSIVGPNRIAPTASAWTLSFIFFSCFCFSFAVVPQLLRLLPLHGEVRLMLATAAVELTAWGLFIAVLTRPLMRQWFHLGLKPTLAPVGVLIGGGAMLILFPLVACSELLATALLHVLHLPEPPPHEVLQDLGRQPSAAMTALLIFVAVIVAPLVEELVFRGFLQTVLGRLLEHVIYRPAKGAGVIESALAASGSADAAPAHAVAVFPHQLEQTPPPALPRWLAVLIAASLFAAVHGVLGFFLPLLLLGIGLGYVYERTGNLYCNMTMHALFNGAQIALFLATGGK